LIAARANASRPITPGLHLLAKIDVVVRERGVQVYEVYDESVGLATAGSVGTRASAHRIAESLLFLAYAEWCAAMDACDRAYAEWSDGTDRDTRSAYAAHVAALDREEAAAVELSHACWALQQLELSQP
jgi:hypothetical protein